jgi:hypothetical protein
VFGGEAGKEAGRLLWRTADARPGEFGRRFKFPTDLGVECRQNIGDIAAAKRGIDLFDYLN